MALNKSAERNFYAESTTNLISSSTSARSNQFSSTSDSSRTSQSRQKSSVQVSGEQLRNNLDKKDPQKSFHQKVENPSNNALSNQISDNVIKQVYRKISVSPAVHQTNQFNESGELGKIRVRHDNIEDLSEDEEEGSISQESQPVVSATSYPKSYEQPPPKPRRSITPSIIIDHNYETKNQTISESVSQSNNRSINQSSNQLNKQLNNQSSSQTSNQSSNQSISQINSQFINQSSKQLNKQIKNQSSSQTSNQSSNHSISQTNNQFINQSSNQLVSQSISQRNNQSNNQASSQSTKQSNNQVVSQSSIQSVNNLTVQPVLQSPRIKHVQSGFPPYQNNNNLYNVIENSKTSKYSADKHELSRNEYESNKASSGFQPFQKVEMPLQVVYQSPKVNSNYQTDKKTLENQSYKATHRERVSVVNENAQNSRGSFSNVQKADIVLQKKQSISQESTTSAMINNNQMENSITQGGMYRTLISPATVNDKSKDNFIQSDDQFNTFPRNHSKKQNFANTVNESSIDKPISKEQRNRRLSLFPERRTEVIEKVENLQYEQRRESRIRTEDLQYEQRVESRTRTQDLQYEQRRESSIRTEDLQYEQRRESNIRTQDLQYEQRGESRIRTQDLQYEQRGESRIRNKDLQYEQRRESNIRKEDMVRAEVNVKHEKVANDVKKTRIESKKEHIMELNNEEFKRNYKNGERRIKKDTSEDDILISKKIIWNENHNKQLVSGNRNKQVVSENHNKQLVKNFQNENVQELNYERQSEISLANTKGYTFNEQTSTERVTKLKNEISSETNQRSYQMEMRKPVDSFSEYQSQQQRNILDSQINSSEALGNRVKSYRNSDGSISVTSKEDSYYNYSMGNNETSKAAYDRRFSNPNSTLRQSEDSSSHSSFSEGMQSFDLNEHRRTSWNDELHSKNKKVNKQQLSVSFEHQQIEQNKQNTFQYISDYQEPFGSNFKISSEEVNKLENKQEYNKSKRVQKSQSLSERNTTTRNTTIRNQQAKSSSSQLQHTMQQQNQLNQNDNTIKILGGSHIGSGIYAGSAIQTESRSHIESESYIRKRNHAESHLSIQSASESMSGNHSKNSSQFKSEIESGSDAGDHFSSNSNESKKKLNINIQSIKREKKLSQSNKFRARSSIQINLRNKDQEYHFGSVNVSEKNGIITLEMDDSENVISNESEDSEWEHQSSFNNEQNIYEKNELSYRHQESSYRHNESSYRANHNRRKSDGDILLSKKNVINSLNHSYDDFLDVNIKAPIETIYYTVCTKYFRPENEDWITNIHRMGNFNVLSGSEHSNNCVFWYDLFNHDNEEIVVQKTLPQENENSFSKIEITKRNKSNNQGKSNYFKKTGTSDMMSEETLNYKNKKTQKKRRFSLLKKPRDHEMNQIFF